MSAVCLKPQASCIDGDRHANDHHPIPYRRLVLCGLFRRSWVDARCTSDWQTTLDINWRCFAGPFGGDGDIANKDCLMRNMRKDRVLARASIGRDVENVRAELAMEQ